MRERPNRTVSKTVVLQGTVGSNPTSSALGPGPAFAGPGPSPVSTINENAAKPTRATISSLGYFVDGLACARNASTRPDSQPGERHD